MDYVHRFIQEDDRTGGNRDKVTEIRRYASEKKVPIKVFFLNDRPGLTLGSMWNDYTALETYTYLAHQTS